ncbi:hypothetical protein MEX01_45290 [Methylorubrum extorquens]|nr:hypothetical protein MEX01_45290 [Methylorubrum extorquens]
MTNSVVPMPKEATASARIGRDAMQNAPGSACVALQYERRNMVISGGRDRRMTGRQTCTHVRTIAREGSAPGSDAGPFKALAERHRLRTRAKRISLPFRAKRENCPPRQKNNAKTIR